MSTIYFEYHCWESEDSSDAELWHHTHQQVEVLQNITLDHDEFKMYRVKFNDGFEYDVFEDELLDSPDEYERPDYMKACKQ